MTESNEPPADGVTFEEHPLYHEAMEQMAQGNDRGAIAKLRELAERFPQEPLLQDLLVRTELRVALADQKPIPVAHHEPAPVLRRVLMMLLALMIVLVVITGFVAAYARLVTPAKESYRQEMLINSLRQEGQVRLEAGDWVGAQEVFGRLLTAVPGDPTAEAAIVYSQQQEALDHQYVEAVAAQQRDDRTTALALLRQIEAQSPGYRDVPQRIKKLEELDALEAAWQQSENEIQAGNWAEAIRLLNQIRAQDPEYRRAQVEEQLFRVYSQMARDLIIQARGSVEVLRQALSYLDQALALRPTERELLDERRLASEFIAAEEAAARGDWASAVNRWEGVRNLRSDYQGGVLADRLAKAYPQAARQRIAEANGNVSVLNQAIRYLDKALTLDPNNQELIEEKRIVTEFLAGVEAFAQEKWDLAIKHWGGIYVLRPNYQNGMLERYLRQACANSPTPDEALCPP